MFAFARKFKMVVEVVQDDDDEEEETPVELTKAMTSLLKFTLNYDHFPSPLFMRKLSKLMNLPWSQVKEWFNQKRIEKRKNGYTLNNKTLKYCPYCENQQPFINNRLGQEHLYEEDHMKKLLKIEQRTCSPSKKIQEPDNNTTGKKETPLIESEIDNSPTYGRNHISKKKWNSKKAQTERQTELKKKHNIPMPQECELLLKPLQQGWVREVVYRTTRTTVKQYDVYYKPPVGKKLRSNVEIAKYLDRMAIQNLTLENFDYSYKCLGENVANENIRNATVQPKNFANLKIKKEEQSYLLSTPKYSIKNKSPSTSDNMGKPSTDSLKKSKQFNTNLDVVIIPLPIQKEATKHTLISPFMDSLDKSGKLTKKADTTTTPRLIKVEATKHTLISPSTKPLEKNLHKKADMTITPGLIKDEAIKRTLGIQSKESLEKSKKIKKDLEKATTQRLVIDEATNLTLETPSKDLLGKSKKFKKEVDIATDPGLFVDESINYLLGTPSRELSEKSKKFKKDVDIATNPRLVIDEAAMDTLGTPPKYKSDKSKRFKSSVDIETTPLLVIDETSTQTLRTPPKDPSEERKRFKSNIHIATTPGLAIDEAAMDTVGTHSKESSEKSKSFQSNFHIATTPGLVINEAAMDTFRTPSKDTSEKCKSFQSNVDIATTPRLVINKTAMHNLGTPSKYTSEKSKRFQSNVDIATIPLLTIDEAAVVARFLRAAKDLESYVNSEDDIGINNETGTKKEIKKWHTPFCDQHNSKHQEQLPSEINQNLGAPHAINEEPNYIKNIFSPLPLHSIKKHKSVIAPNIKKEPKDQNNNIPLLVTDTHTQISVQNRSSDRPQVRMMHMLDQQVDSRKTTYTKNNPLS